MNLLGIDARSVSVTLTEDDCRLLELACTDAEEAETGRDPASRRRRTAFGALAGFFAAAGMAHDACTQSVEMEAFSLERYHNDPERAA